MPNTDTMNAISWRCWRTRLVLAAAAALALGFWAAPRAHACEVDDDIDAVAEGILKSDDQGGDQATKSMSCKLLVSGPHIKVTSHRQPTPADIARAKQIRAQFRQALAKYEDYGVALKDGFEIKFPNTVQKIYHFTNIANAQANAREGFSNLRPTSLLYEKNGTGYKLVGVMYTAPRNSTEAELDSRFPVSVAPWHEHTNICQPPPGFYSHKGANFDRRFGPKGTIATEADCTAVGGHFIPVVFGWMTHVDFDDSGGKS